MAEQEDETLEHATRVEGTTFRLIKDGTLTDSVLEPVASNAAEPEDEYQQYYIGRGKGTLLIQPPLNLRRIYSLADENNALGPCVEAMVTNIDGTGYSFESRDETQAEDKEDDAKIEELKEFFSQPWPGESWTTVRKKVRRDLERTGNGYLEVLRDAGDRIAFVRHVDAKMMRLVKLDAAVPVKKTIRRGGKDITVTVMERERRYAQLLNGIALFYFKAFGASRDLDKNTGEWCPQGSKLVAKKRATEIIHLTVNPDANTPYGLPRWVAQTPSVLGSRKAEEFNLEFFDEGGVPPVMILVQGGTMAAKTKQAIEAKVRGKKANRTQVIEVDPGGSLDKPSTAKVTVERFGADRQTDSMFEDYDAKCEERVRRSFRLPPIFVGQAADYSFATAFASYTVAEAQVFAPERDEFDEVISIKLLPAMGYADYRMKSNPLNIEDATLKLEGLTFVQGLGVVKAEDLVEEANKTIGTKLKVDPAAVKRAENTAMGLNPDGSKPAPPPLPGMGGKPSLPPPKGASVAKPGSPSKPGGAKPAGIQAVKAPALPAPKAGGTAPRGPVSKMEEILIGEEDPIFVPDTGDAGTSEVREHLDNAAMAAALFAEPHHAPEELAELAGCTMAMIAAQIEGRLQ